MICETMDLIHYQFTQIASIYVFNFLDFSTAMSNLELSYVANFGSLDFRDEAKIFELSELGIHEQHKSIHLPLKGLFFRDSEQNCKRTAFN